MFRLFTLQHKDKCGLCESDIEANEDGYTNEYNQVICRRCYQDRKIK